LPAIPLSIAAAPLAAVLGVTERAVQGRARDGRLPRSLDGLIDLHAVVRAGVEVLAKRQAGGEDDLDINAERARLAKEQADAQQMKNDVSRGQLVPRPDVVVGMQVAFAAARARLLSLPTKAAPLLVGLETPTAARDILTDLVNEACGELAATRAIPAASDRPADGGGGDRGAGRVGAAPEADGERVGRPRADALARGKRRAG
jgi:phage terminase Nu1 subunit (DNA packaging protein)